VPRSLLVFDVAQAEIRQAVGAGQQGNRPSRTAVRHRPGIRHLIAGTPTSAQAVEQDAVTILKGNLQRFTELFRLDG